MTWVPALAERSTKEGRETTVSFDATQAHDSSSRPREVLAPSSLSDFLFHYSGSLRESLQPPRLQTSVRRTTRKRVVRLLPFRPLPPSYRLHLLPITRSPPTLPIPLSPDHLLSAPSSLPLSSVPVETHPASRPHTSPRNRSPQRPSLHDPRRSSFLPFRT